MNLLALKTTRASGRNVGEKNPYFYLQSHMYMYMYVCPNVELYSYSNSEDEASLDVRA